MTYGQARGVRGRRLARIVLPLVGPFDLALSLKAAASFLPPQGPISPALRVGISLEGRPAIVEIRQTGRRLEASGPVRLGSARLRKIAGSLANIDLDLRPFYALSYRHPALERVANSLYGLKPLRPASLFEMLVIAITEQQLSLAAAFHIRRRLIERFGNQCDGLWIFPSSTRISEASIPELRESGLSGRKAEYIRAIADQIAAGRLDLAALERMDDARARNVLARQRGLGEWSVDYILARGLGRVDCLPSGDAGLRRVVGRYLSGQPRLSPEELEQALAPFVPYRALAAYYLAAHWRLFEIGPVAGPT